MANTDFQLQDGEKIFYEGKLNQIKGKLNITEGSGYLTNKRFVRYEANIALKVIIGLLAHFFKQKLAFDIPLQDIRTIKRKQTGLNKKHAFSLTTTDGAEIQLVSFKLDDLLAAFQKAYDQNPTLTFSELGHEEWFIQGATSHATTNNI